MPSPGELSPYYQSYLHYLQTEDMLASLAEQQTQTVQFLSGVDPTREKSRYAEGKWSVREVAGHICDAERIMAYRALCFARKDPTALPGFEENDYTLHSNYDSMLLADIVKLLDSLRTANVLMFRSFTPDMFDCKGMANGEPVSVRALLYFIIVHQKHHLTVIKERYLGLR